MPQQMRVANDYKIAREFELKYKAYLEGVGPWVYKIESTLKLARLVKDELLLDVGCGIGTFAMESVKRGAQAVGLDFSKRMIQCAKKLSKKYGINSAYILASATNIPFRAETFDKVIICDVIEHLYKPDLTKCLEECHRVLKKEKIIIIHTSPGKYFFMWRPRVILIRIELLIKKLLGMPIENHWFIKLLRGHVNLQSVPNLKKRLMESGFIIEEIFGTINPEVERSGCVKLLKKLVSQTERMKPPINLLATNIFAVARARSYRRKLIHQ